MLFDKLVENSFKASKLPRVRINVDPATNPCFGYENCVSFEGYVLEECGNNLQVYILNVPNGIDPIQQVAKTCVAAIPEPQINPKSGDIKNRVLEILKQKGISEDTPEFKQIQNSNSPEFIESYIKQMKLDDDTLMSIFSLLYPGVRAEAAEAPTTPSLSPDDLGSQSNSWVDKANAIGKGASMFSKHISTPFKLAFGKDNIAARLNRFLSSFNVRDLIDIKDIKLSSREYAHIPFKGEPVFISGLPTLSYQKFNNTSYQLKGQITGRQLSLNGIKHEIGNIEPSVPGLSKILLDFKITDNTEREGKVIFIINDKQRVSDAKILLVYNTWVIKIKRYGTASNEPQSSEEYGSLIKANKLLKYIFEGNYKAASQKPSFQKLLVKFKQNFNNYSEEQSIRVISLLDQLKQQKSFSIMSLDNQIKEVDKFIDYINTKI